MLAPPLLGALIEIVFKCVGAAPLAELLITIVVPPVTAAVEVVVVSLMPWFSCQNTKAPSECTILPTGSRFLPNSN